MSDDKAEATVQRPPDGPPVEGPDATARPPSGDAAPSATAEAPRPEAPPSPPTTASDAAGPKVVEAPAADAAEAKVRPAEPAPAAEAKPADEPARPAAEAKPADEPARPAAEAKPADEPEAKPAETGPAVSEAKPEPAPTGPARVVVHLAGSTDVGRIREHNEDNYLLAELTDHRRGAEPFVAPATVGPRGLLFAVCDGMGGALAGEIASQMAVDIVHGIVQDGEAPEDRDRFAHRLVTAIQEAGARIFLAAKTNRDRHGMGTTSTVAGVFGATLFVGQVGDSRAYLLRRGRMKQITKDQSLVSKLIEAGQLTEEQAESYEHAHIILQALGTADTVSVDLSFVELRKGDVVMLCSDGLSGLATAEQMREVLASVDDPTEACEELIRLANEGGGHDNITVIVGRFDGDLPECALEDEGIGYQPYVLEDPVEALVVGRASSTIKAPDLPPPGSDVKKANSMPPEMLVDKGVAELFDPVQPRVPSRPAAPDEPVELPMSKGADAVSWVLVAGVVLGVVIAVWLLLRTNAGPSEPAHTSTQQVSATPVTEVRPGEPVAPTQLPPPQNWGDAGAAGATGGADAAVAEAGPAAGGG